MDVIDSFMKRYEQERDDWTALKDVAVEVCNAGLKDIGVQGIVTSRVKTDSSLRKKLRIRNDTWTNRPSYRDHQAIMDDQMDFVGLRIALYFPNQKQQVIEMLKTKFQYEAIRPFDRNWKPDEPGIYQHLFGQYVADHIWVYLRPEDRGGTRTKNAGKYAWYRFEIQLRSVLMDAWAGISQDLEYKALSGELTVTEHKLLDAIKGHVEVGELMLEQLHRVHRKRVDTENEQIKTPRDLGEILIDSIPTGQISNLEIGNLDTLLVGLAGIGADTPRGVRAILGKLKAKTNLQNDLAQWKHDFYPVPGTLSFFLLEKMLPNVNQETKRFCEVNDKIRELRPRKWFDSRYWQPLLWLSKELLKGSIPSPGQPAFPNLLLSSSDAIRKYSHIWCAQFYLNTQTPTTPQDSCVIECLSRTRDRSAPGVEFLAELCVLGLAPTAPKYTEPREEEDSRNSSEAAVDPWRCPDDRFEILAVAMQRGYSAHPQAWIQGVHDFVESIYMAHSTLRTEGFLRSADITLWLMSLGEQEHLLSELLQHWPFKGRLYSMPAKEACATEIIRTAETRGDQRMEELLRGPPGQGFRVLDISDLVGDWATYYKAHK